MADGDVHLEMTENGAAWVPNADVADPGDQYPGETDYTFVDCVIDQGLSVPSGTRMGDVLDALDPDWKDMVTSATPKPTSKETPVSYRLNATISDEAHEALVAVTKEGETIQDTTRRVLHKALKLPKPAK